MAQVTVRLPALLTEATGGRKRLAVDADTVQGAIDRLLAEHPALKVHLFEESGALRPHVNLFYNDDDVRRLQSLQVPARDGDALTVMQAVSGG